MESDSLKKILPYLQHKYFSNGITVLLIILLAYQLAGITWLVLAGGEQNNSPWQGEGGKATQQTSSPINIAGLLEVHVFGKAKKAPVTKAAPKAINAKATPLNVQLSGVVASTNPKKSLAIIVNRGQQETLGIDEKIKGTQAKITQILSDRVIVDNRGSTEFIMLDGAKDEPQAQRQAPARNDKKKQTKSIGKQAIRDKVAELRQNPGKLTDYLRISPVREDGEMQGYRINPGKERLLFTEFDLKPNDLAVAFNGYDLKDSAQAMAVMKELANLTEASITVERDGQLHDVFIQLP